MDMSEMVTSINKIQTEYICYTCNYMYNIKWFSRVNKKEMCIFCECSVYTKDIITNKRTRLLKEFEWNYTRSGESNRKSYFNNYINQLNYWCAIHHIRSVKSDKDLEAYIEFSVNQDYVE
jgi:hypothetical protein